MKTKNSCHGRGENGSSYGELQRDKPDEMSVVGKLNGKLNAFCFFFLFLDNVPSPSDNTMVTQKRCSCSMLQLSAEGQAY